MSDRAPSPSGQRSAELRLLHRVSTELGAARELSEVLELTLDTLEERFAPEHCSVFLLEPESQYLVLRERRGEPLPGLRSRVRLGSGIVGAAAAKREIVRLNMKGDPLQPLPTEIRSRMAIPMVAANELVGAICLSTRGDSVLRKEDETAVTILASQAAVAIQNSRLYAGLQSLNAELEERVRQRTAELERAQAQLVQSGKMATLGQLAAGLSHEMNTPLGAIAGSSDVSDRALALLRESGLLEVAPAPTARKLERALGAMADTSRATREATARLFTIFEALRNFAKLDEASLQWVDLRQGLDSTLALLGHRLGERIEVTRDYGELPRVHCHASELNQVFLVLLTNAADAIDGAGRITLRARAPDRTHVELEIIDSGRGIAADRLERVFDSGFTTKGARIGSGLSLSIARTIMHEHAGTLTLESEPGRGTTARLRLPVDGSLA